MKLKTKKTITIKIKALIVNTYLSKTEYKNPVSCKMIDKSTPIYFYYNCFNKK